MPVPNCIRRPLAGAVLMLAIGVALAAPTPACAQAELRCRKAIESALTKWALETSKHRQQCQAGIISGLSAPSIDCLSGSGSPGLQQQLAAARARLEERITKGCAGASFGLLSYPGPCPDVEPFDAVALADCIEREADEVFSELFAVWYPSPLGYFRGPAADCARIVPKRAAGAVLREMRARLRCLLAAEVSGDQTAVDCRAQLVPYGPGTGSREVDTAVWRAQKTWLSGIPRACSIAEFQAMGYGASCDEGGGNGAGLVDLHACVFRSGRFQVPVLLDLAFPSDPVCGNGILQEGEACDQGVGNSDTRPNACRLDCTLPFCGDRVTDTAFQEQCDDGNAQSLDGCTPDCILEFCGDGIVNNLPNETCDDGNTNPNDRCTGSCQEAVCGDGVVCSDPSCTSGPGGGPELCDLGAGNAPGGRCDTTCFGWSRACTLTIGVTNSVRLGALTYELSYASADGAFEGTGGAVKCRSTVTGGLVSFFDDESARTVKESLIVDAGVQTPTGIAECDYVTNDFSLAPGKFSFEVQAASDPSFNPVTVNLAVTSILCQP